MNAPTEEFTETSKNWNDLPVEMKVKCIGKMDFKTRTCLRSTSTRDRQMVDSVKQPINSVLLVLNPKNTIFAISCSFPNQIKITKRFSDKEEGNGRETNLSSEVEKFNKVFQFFKQILERSEISEFNMHIDCEEEGNEDLKLITEMIESGPLLRISSVEFFWEPNSSVQLAILKKCDDSLKSIEITSINYIDKEKATDFLNVPNLLNVKKVIIKHTCRTQETVQWGAFIIKSTIIKWCEETASIGSEYFLYHIYDSFFLDLVNQFQERVKRKNEDQNAYCFQMNDKDKQMWLRLSPRDVCLHCFVVAADSEEPDFRKMDYLRIDEPIERRDRARMKNLGLDYNQFRVFDIRNQNAIAIH